MYAQARSFARYVMDVVYFFFKFAMADFFYLLFFGVTGSSGLVAIVGTASKHV